MIVRACRSTIYSERQRPDLWDRCRSVDQILLVEGTRAHQKFTGLYLFATIWTIKRVALSNVANTDAVPSLKCEERYSNVDACKADL